MTVTQHPEDYCHRCLNPNLSWFIDPAVWNPVMRPEGDDAPWRWNEIICPQCFAELFEEKFGPTSFELRLHPETRGGKAFQRSLGVSS